MAKIDSLLKTAKKVRFGDLYLDPNNPRLPEFISPGYEDVDDLFDKEAQKKLEELLMRGEDFQKLVESVVGAGWMAVDNIITWEHPKRKGKFLVVEGNRRVTALRALRRKRDEEKENLKDLKETFPKPKGDEKGAIAQQETLVENLQEIVNDTENLLVLPLHCPDPLKISETLMRVLAVRHINGAKTWGAYAQDQFMFVRYQQLFEDLHGDIELFLDQNLINTVAQETSVSAAKCKQTIRGIKAFENFKAGCDFEAAYFFS